MAAALEKQSEMAKKLAARAVRPPLEKFIAKEGLEWADVAPVISVTENLSVADIENAVAQPEEFLKKLADASAPLARKLLLKKARKLAPMKAYWEKKGLDYDADVKPILEELDSVEKMREAVEVGCSLRCHRAGF